MTEQTLIERVARAMFEKNIRDGLNGEDEWPIFADLYLTEARTAIEAIRDPSATMMDAMLAADDNFATVRKIWVAGIDAALAETNAGNTP